MNMKKLVVLFLFLMSLNGMAQQVNDFSLNNINDGKNVALKDYSSARGIIIIFTLNNCPFDDYYADRIKALAQTNIPVLLINSGPDDTDGIDAMKTRAKKFGLTMPYLADKDQSVMADLNARKSTESFLLRNDGGKFTVYYHGAIDDNPQLASATKHNYLKDAITNLLAGNKADVVDARPAGCSIRKK